MFTAYIEFVELQMTGCMLERRTVVVPPELTGIVDEKSRRLLEMKFRLLDEQDAGAWGEEVRRIKDYVVRRFLVKLPGYGYVLRTSDKPKFELAVKTLRKLLDRARRRKARDLQQAIDKRMAALADVLMPIVARHPPEGWQWGSPQFDATKALRRELAQVAGSAQKVLADARVELRFKGVTLGTLRDPQFAKLVKERMPDLHRLHAEEDVVATH